MSDQAGQTSSPRALSRKALYSVCCGTAAFACIYITPLLGLVIGLPSITSGIHARREIAASRGRLAGDSLAVIGLMIGSGAVLTVLLSWALSVVTEL